MTVDTARTVKAKAKYVIEKKLGGIMTWTADQDNGLLINAAREGLGCKIKTQVIDMSPFYFFGKNVNNTGPEKGLVAIISGPNKEVAAGDEVHIRGDKSFDYNEKPITFEWKIPQGLKVIGEIDAKNISVIVPKDKPRKNYQITLTVNNGKETATATFSLKVKKGEISQPKAIITGPAKAAIGVATLLSGESSKPSYPDGKLSHYFFLACSEISQRLKSNYSYVELYYKCGEGGRNFRD